MHVSIDEALKRKCPRTALGCVTAQGKAEAAPADLLAEMQACVAEIVKLPEPRGILESPDIAATRAAYKALGKDPARYRGSAEALLRRVIAGKGLPQISAVVDVINLVSVESRLPTGLYDLAHVSGDIVFRAGRAGGVLRRRHRRLCRGEQCPCRQPDQAAPWYQRRGRRRRPAERHHGAISAAPDLCRSAR